MSRIVLSGYYGFDNAGDEAVLAGLVKAFRARQPPAELRITALSVAPDATARYHSVDSAHRMRIGAMIRALAGADLLASGGGSLLQDATSAHSVFYYLGVVRLAQMMGKRTMFIAQGIGPLNLPRSRKLTASVANRLDAITVRDPASAELLRAIGVTRPPIDVTADPALLLSPGDAGRSVGATRRDMGDTSADAFGAGAANRPLSDARRAENTQSQALPAQRIGLALRPWNEQTSVLIDDLANAWGATLPMNTIVDMPMHRGADEEVNAQFARKLNATVVPGKTDMWDLVKAASKCSIVVAMRLHALIFAAAAGVPAVALSYDPKVAAFMRQTGQSDAIYDITERNPDKLAAIIRDVWANREARANTLGALLPDLRNAAQRNADIALGLVL